MKRKCASPRAARAPALAVALSAILPACAPQPEPPSGEASSPPPSTRSEPASAPAAIPSENGYEPIGVDEVGCVMYAYRPPEGGAGPATIFWRTQEGAFTIDRELADCPSTSRV